MNKHKETQCIKNFPKRPNAIGIHSTQPATSVTEPCCPKELGSEPINPVLPVRQILRLTKVKAEGIVVLFHSFDLPAGAKRAEPGVQGELPASALSAA